MANKKRVEIYLSDIESMIEDFSHWSELTEFERVDHSLEWTLSIERYRKHLLTRLHLGELSQEQIRRLNAITQWLTEHQAVLEKVDLVTLKTNYSA